MRSVLDAAPKAGKPLVLCSKGIEEKSGALLHHVAREACPDSPIAVLSGPTFAHEVAAGLPTAVTLAGDGSGAGRAIACPPRPPAFRIYLTDDVTGAEIGGAVKNVLAIACGVVEGKGLGQNARAALIARGFAEMTRFGLANGARRETLAGLSGLGDLVLTCSSTSSRNFSLGKGIGEGRSAAELMADRRTVAEGAFTAPVLARLARERGRHADGRGGRRPDCRPLDRRRDARTIAQPPAAPRDAIVRRLEIDGDALLLPVAVAGRVQPLLLALRRRGTFHGSGAGTGGDLLR